MDGQQFDRLTRLVAGTMPRRRLLRRAAGVLTGALLAGAAGVRVKAITCPNGIECDGRCCTDGYECIGWPGDFLCVPPCVGADGSRCARGCCNGVCCAGINRLQTCCPPGEGCCPGAGSSECCPSDWDCLGTEGGNICLRPCGENTTRCGVTCCNADQRCQNEECVGCPAGTSRCGDVCCSEGQTCENNQCVTGGSCRAGTRLRAQDGCEVCPKGTVRCQGRCVPVCKKAKKNRRQTTLDGGTCTCTKQKCPKGTEKCSGECTFTQGDPENCGGCSIVCPVGGICCNGKCESAGGSCCGSAVCNPNQECCSQEKNLCCDKDACCAGSCCAAGYHCCKEEKGCCPNQWACCGTVCCPPFEYCADAKNSICCPDNSLRCGKVCCRAGLACNREKGQCCPEDAPYWCAKKQRCNFRPDCKTIFDP